MRSIIKKWKAGVIALSTGALVVSCNSDFLDRPTLGTMDETTFLKTEEAGYKLLTSCYQPMLDIWAFEQMWFDLGDQITDDCSKGGSDAADRVTISELTRGNPPTTNSMLTDIWNHRFKIGISACNVFPRKRDSGDRAYRQWRIIGEPRSKGALDSGSKVHACVLLL